MPGFFSRLFASKGDSVGFRRAMAKRLDGRAVKYVTERVGDVDSVIGHSGALILRGDELIVYSSQDVVFRARVDDLRMSELMSLDGVILSSADLEHGGAERTIIAYYTYYLKTRD